MLPARSALEVGESAGEQLSEEAPMIRMFRAARAKRRDRDRRRRLNRIHRIETRRQRVENDFLEAMAMQLAEIRGLPEALERHP